MAVLLDAIERRTVILALTHYVVSATTSRFVTFVLLMLQSIQRRSFVSATISSTNQKAEIPVMLVRRLAYNALEARSINASAVLLDTTS